MDEISVEYAFHLLFAPRMVGILNILKTELQNPI